MTAVLSRSVRRVIVLLVLGGVILGFGHRIETLSYQAYVQDLKLDAARELIEVRERIRTQIFDQILKLHELTTIISENPDISQTEFSARAAEFSARNPEVLNLAAARDLVVNIVHPLESNKSVLGLDYRENPAQLPKVQQAMNSGSGLITGPVDLVQGGRGMILRQPVFYAQADGSMTSPRPWGLLSMVIDYDRFVEQLEISETLQTYDVVIRELDTAGNVEQVIVGAPDIALADPIKLDFNFAFGLWELAATTKGGWPDHRPDFYWNWLLRLLVAAAAMTFASYVMRLSETRHLAEERLRTGIEALDHGFVMFDPSGTLVLCNEKYREIHGYRDVIKPGSTYERIARDSIRRGLVPDAVGKEEEWIRIWLEKREQGAFETEQRMSDGRIIRTSDRRMEDGSVVGLRIDVTDIKRALMAAEDANKAKTDFMGVLSHELRTPLTVILGHVRLARHFDRAKVARDLQDAVHSDPQTNAALAPKLDAVFAKLGETMQTVERSGNHLLTLINEVLDFAKIDAGSLSIDMAPVKIDDIVTPSAEQLRPMIEDKGLKLHVASTKGTLLADGKRIQQILINLLSNAIKFSDQGEISLVSRVRGEVVEFRVTDNGIGIPEEELERVFEPFHQVDSTATRRFGGTGLGLAISRDIAIAHGGNLVATSILGKGSSFLLTLPMHPAHAVKTAPAKVTEPA
ncbi:CHASE domain-containing protein [Sulfitobacter sp. S0837]|uniref:ATP-binding protein n=1 Tax=Sulfitobacter maritimus TaxID=2741719 RepID=UPI001581906C|nr:ATP-binding protein [Sulfitobacter maritimus]NUH65688.1 CHASE domain-containing protein [Sulfitobacter maritimus]